MMVAANTGDITTLKTPYMFDHEMCMRWGERLAHNAGLPIVGFGCEDRDGNREEFDQPSTQR